MFQCLFIDLRLIYNNSNNNNLSLFLESKERVEINVSSPHGKYILQVHAKDINETDGLQVIERER